MHDLKRELEARREAGLYRERRTIESPQGREIVVDGRRLLNFCSNDYLGLGNDPRVNAAFAAGIERWGTGSGASHLVTGHTGAHAALEAALADFTGRPRALVFSSGFAANTGTIAALMGRKDHVFQDRLNHASLLDGARLSGARLHRYPHRDTVALRDKLGRVPEGRRLVVSDGTFSMDGTVCDLAGLAATARDYDAWLMIDEAHSLGVLGDRGRGLVATSGTVNERVHILIGTLGKAFGTQGGFVAGSDDLIETLIQQGRPYIYSTAMPSALAVATLTSLEIAAAEEWRRTRLQELINRFRAGAADLGLELIDSATPIQPVVLGDAAAAVELSRRLEARGVLAMAIRPPTVPPGTSRLRITLTALHTDDDIGRLLTALKECQT